MIFRHLDRLLNSGVRVTVASTSGLSHLRCSHINIPRRRWWWPPYRTSWNFLVRLRSFLCARDIVNSLSAVPSVVLTIIDGPHAIIAKDVAKLTKSKLICLVHDNPAVWGDFHGGRKFADHWSQQVVAASSACLAVTKDLLAYFDTPKETIKKILLPIPAEPLGLSIPSHVFERNPEFYIVGSLYGLESLLFKIFAEIQKLGGNLTIVCSPSQNINEMKVLVKNIEGVEVIPAFPKPDDCLRFLSARATAVIVPYASPRKGVNNFLKESFPSRLAEFSQVGLPIFIIAPADYAVTRWGICNGWRALVDPDSDEDWKLLRDCLDDEKWMSLASQSACFYELQFHPDRIHAEFVECLL